MNKKMSDITYLKLIVFLNILKVHLSIEIFCLHGWGDEHVLFIWQTQKPATRYYVTLLSQHSILFKLYMHMCYFFRWYWIQDQMVLRFLGTSMHYYIINNKKGPCFGNLRTGEYHSKLLFKNQLQCLINYLFCGGGGGEWVI